MSFSRVLLLHKNKFYRGLMFLLAEIPDRRAQKVTNIKLTDLGKFLTVSSYYAVTVTGVRTEQ